MAFRDTQNTASAVGGSLLRLSEVLPRASWLAAAALAVALPGLAPRAKGATFTWAGAGAAPSWGTVGNFSPAPTFNNTSDLDFPTSAVTQTDTFLGNPRTVRSLNFGSFITGAFAVNYRDFAGAGGAARNLTLDTDAVGGNASITVAAGSTGTITLGFTGADSYGTLTLADNLVIDHQGSGRLNFNRNIGGVGFSVTKNGPGTMETTTSNQFTGAMNINAGRWIVSQGVFSAAFAGLDLDNSSGVNFGGGALEVVGGATSTVAKTFITPFTVNAPSTLAYNNLSTTSRIMTLGSGSLATSTLTLNANLTIDNLSGGTTSLVNGINISRSITGAGQITVNVNNDINSVTDATNLRRVQFSGNNPGWSGGVVIARGTATVNAPAASNPLGTGTIEIGTMSGTFGAVLAFNQAAATPVTLGNHVIVRNGGYRAIRNNGDFATNIILSGPMTLEGDLTIDHTNLNADRFIALNGDASGPGGINVFRSGGNALSDARLGGFNTYLGNTTVNTGATLLVNGSITSPLTSVATGARVGGQGSSSGAVTVASGGFVAPGDATFNVSTLSIGSLTTSTLSLGGSVGLEFDLASIGSDRLVITSPDGFSATGVNTFTLNEVGGTVAGTYTLIDYAGTALPNLSAFTLASATFGAFNATLVNNTANTSVDLTLALPVVASAWAVDSDGSWGTASNWTAGVPDASGVVANFGSAILAPRTVTIDAPRTIGVANFDNASAYTLAGATLNLNNGTSASQLNVANGNHSISAPVVVSGALSVDVTPSGSVLALAALEDVPASFSKAGAGALLVNRVRAQSLDISAGKVEVTPGRDTAKTSVVSGLTVASGAQLDLGNNDFVLNYTGSSPRATVESLITAGQGGATGIITSVATSNQALGVADRSDLGNPATFSGVNLTGDAVLVRFTLRGDTNLSGKVDITDFAVLAANFNQPGRWVTGDADFNGIVNISDFSVLAANFNQSLLGDLPRGASVPEPASLGFLGLATQVLGRRRRV